MEDAVKRSQARLQSHLEFIFHGSALYFIHRFLSSHLNSRRRSQKLLSVLQQRSASPRSRKSVACGSVLELKIKVDFLGEAEKINLPKKGTGGCHIYPMCGRSVSDGKNGTNIDKIQRRDYTLTQPVFCPINGVHLSV